MLGKYKTVFQTKGDFFGAGSDKFIDSFITFVFTKLPPLTIGLSILYMLYNIIAPAIIIVK